MSKPLLDQYKQNHIVCKVYTWLYFQCIYKLSHLTHLNNHKNKLDDHHLNHQNCCQSLKPKTVTVYVHSLVSKASSKERDSQLSTSKNLFMQPVRTVLLDIFSFAI